MNKSFTDILDELPPEELGRLLEGVDLKGEKAASDRLSALVAERMGASEGTGSSGRAPSGKKRPPRRFIWALAAALALLIALGAGTYAYAAEAKEYKAAKEFFADSGLSMEGLSRGEIKAVCRDIETDSYTCEKTAEILAAVDNSAIPDDVLDYAEGECMASIKAFMKRPGSGYIDEEKREDGGENGGIKFSSAEEIDELTLGQGYRLSHLKTVVEERGDTLADSIEQSDSWIFSLDYRSCPAFFFEVAKEEGVFTYSGAMSAYNLSTALSVMKRLAAKAGVRFEPVILEVNIEHLVAQDFNGDDRIIIVTGDWSRIDEEYLSATWYGQLPTYNEFIAAYNESFIPYIDPETGEPIDLTQVPSGVGGSNSVHPDLSVEAPEKTVYTGSSILRILPIAAAALIAAAMAIFALRSRKSNEN